VARFPGSRQIARRTADLGEAWTALLIFSRAFLSNGAAFHRGGHAASVESRTP